jgi:hypothetical protein
MRAGYKAFLMGTATDLPTRGYRLENKTPAQAMFDDIRKWNKVVSNLQH